jgi:amino acid transporter
MMQALAEMSVLYPINGAFTMYICRFVDPSFGFACGWEYAISWLTVLPYEISAAVNIIHYWPGSLGINSVAWIVPLLVALVIIQFFGVRGYAEVEYALSLMKIIACVGFMILGIIIDVGGVPSDKNRGYIGGEYWFVLHLLRVSNKKTDLSNPGTHRTRPSLTDSMVSAAFSSLQPLPTLAPS